MDRKGKVGYKENKIKVNRIINVEDLLWMCSLLYRVKYVRYVKDVM